jgi:pimeloyl-ACP methyl ester carboxylesterase
MKSERLFDGDLIRATLFNPGQSQLFVSFRQRVNDPGEFGDGGPVRSFIDHGMTHLHLQSRWNDWYINNETKALEAMLDGFAPGFDRAVAMGFSMGGYAAFRFARTLRLKQVIAVSPQFSISPDHVPFDRRYRESAKGFNAALGDLSARGCDVGGVIMADPFRPMDLRNAHLIRAAFPAVQIARLAGAGHPASRVIREGGKFGKLQAQLTKTRVPLSRIITLHRNARRNSPRYWRHLAAQARKSGRDTLAVEAEKRSLALESQS